MPSGRPRPLALLLLLALSGSAAAHTEGGAVETRIDFPGWVAWGAGALVVALSFVVVAGISGPAQVSTHRAHANAAAAAAARSTSTRATPLRLAVAALLLAAVGAAFLPALARAPALVLFLGLAGVVPLLSYLVGNAWEPASPFRLLPARGRARLPAWVGAWPAVAVVLAIAGLEMAAAGPLAIAGFLAVYIVITGLAVLAFGHSWLAEGEAFGALARAYAHVAPALSPRTWRGRAPPAAEGWSGAALVVALLWVVNFDGLVSTRAGAAATAALGAAAVPVLLVAGYAAFLGAFVAAVRLLARAAESLRPTRALAAAFAPALLPIAAAYHAAHIVPALVEAVAPLPAWALAGVGGFQVATILAGHVLAVAFAHRIAYREFPSRVMAVRGELPLTAAMVAYTVVGLAILTGGAG